MSVPEGTHRLEGHITAFTRNAPAQGIFDPVCRYEEPSGTSLRLVIMAARYDDAAVVGHLDFVTGLTHTGGNFEITCGQLGYKATFDFDLVATPVASATDALVF
jgi:hypothetical protein